MPKTMLFIFNPYTGGGRLKNKLMQILCEFADAGYMVTTCPTTAMGDARRFAQNAQDYDLVVCCGGDGTLNEVVDGIRHHKTPPLVGYIPGGTTNDFAASLLLPKSDMLTAARRIIHPKKIFQCDIGLFNEQAFTYVAAFGAFTDVPYRTKQKFKNVLGYFAYILEAASRLPTLRTSHVALRCDGCEIEDDFLVGMITNSSSLAGFSFPNKQRPHLDDGLFEVLLVHRPTHLSDLGALSAALLTRNVAHPGLTTLRASSIAVTGAEPIAWTLDGEFGGECAQANITVLPKSLHICI